MIDKQVVFAQLDAKVATLKRAVLISIPATPVAVLALQGIAVWKYGLPGGKLTGLLPGLITWSIVMYAIIALSSFLLIRRQSKKIAEAKGIIDAGTPQIGTVMHLAHCERQAGGVQMNKLTATLQTADGAQHTVWIEEPIGTEVPALNNGETMTVWVGPAGVAAATETAVLCAPAGG